MNKAYKKKKFFYIHAPVKTEVLDFHTGNSKS